MWLLRICLIVHVALTALSEATESECTQTLKNQETKINELFKRLESQEEVIKQLIKLSQDDQR